MSTTYKYPWIAMRILQFFLRLQPYLFNFFNTYTKHAPFIIFKIKYQQTKRHSWDLRVQLYSFKIVGKKLVYEITFGERDYVTQRLY